MKKLVEDISGSFISGVSFGVGFWFIAWILREVFK